MSDAGVNTRVEELLALIRERAGEPEELYPLVCDGERVQLVGEEEDDEEPLCWVLCPPVSEGVVAAAEASLGFPLPPLLRAVYTRVGNGGLCLGLLGLDGGQPGGDDLFPGLSAVAIYHTLDEWRRDGKLGYLPPGLYPINDGLGCGMVDYLDCRTPDGGIRRTDSGRLTDRRLSLRDYLRGAVEDYGTSFGRGGNS
ncbi:MAG: hypothetical protein K2X82_11690 [Gemmataceae bacterium]|nr:hypothetical protein [Gemmataceae bacterium]